jgi:hypothetical protein|tara:strand:+ start:618 stop:848 length:231 start_codon:yes stop_codon:yes gene_type:complete
LCFTGYTLFTAAATGASGSFEAMIKGFLTRLVAVAGLVKQLADRVEKILFLSVIKQTFAEDLSRQDAALSTLVGNA